MSQNVRMSDIAKRVGTSTVTVSKALAGKPGVGGDLRRKIENTAREMGYKKEKTDIPRQTGNIGVIVPAASLSGGEQYCWELYRKTADYFGSIGYFCMLDAPPDSAPLPRMLKENRVDGVIIIGGVKKGFYEELKKTGFPMVFLNTYDGDDGKTCVITDGYYGMYTLTKYLIDIGHKTVFFVGDASAQARANDRCFGYFRAMGEIGVSVTENMLIMGGGSYIALPDNMPSAFVCAEGHNARTLIKQLGQKGYIVPRDVSVAAFCEHLPDAEPGEIPLTVYRADTDELVKTAADELAGRIKNPVKPPKLRVVTGMLAKNESTEPRRG